MIDRGLAVRAMGLYGPVMVALLLAYGRRRERRVGAAVLLGLLWTMAALLALQRVNLAAGWWSFRTDGPVLRGMPVELYLGWGCLWGAVPVLAFRRVRVGGAVLAMVALDAVVMPLCGPVVVLGRMWWVGEAVAAGLVLTPGLLLARWTLEGRRLGWRAAMQVAAAGGVFLYLLPEIMFTVRGGGWGQVVVRGPWLAITLQGLAVLALPGISAVQEFVERGGGTPIPYDPPQRLVVSGIYRYVANPMQVGCTLVLIAWGGLLGSWWVAAGGLIAVIYSAGLAEWDEGEDLRGRFGEVWVAYRVEVRDWRFRVRPFVGETEALLYVARGCGVCSEVRRWFAARGPVGMVLCAAEEYPVPPLRRMRYDPGDGSPAEDGVRAFARGLEHLHLGWALAGMALRLPGVRWAVQVVLDGVGFGEWELKSAGAAESDAVLR